MFDAARGVHGALVNLHTAPHSTERGNPTSAPKRRGLTQTMHSPQQTEMAAAGALVLLQALDLLVLPALLVGFVEGRQRPSLLLRHLAGFLLVPWLLVQEDLL